MTLLARAQSSSPRSLAEYSIGSLKRIQEGSQPLLALRKIQDRWMRARGAILHLPAPDGPGELNLAWVAGLPGPRDSSKS